MRAIKLQDQCPKCGTHLMIREGEYGDFLACPRFPACKFTKPLPDNDLAIYKTPSPYCEKCNHSGLLPFKNKKGEVIPHTYLFCECNSGTPYPFQYTPEQFDFPMSYSCYRSLCREHGWSDPGAYEALGTQEPEPTIEPSWRREQWKVVDSLRGELTHIHAALHELQKKKRPVRDTYTIT